MKRPIAVDIVILSYAKDESLKGLTDQTIQTLLDSEQPGDICFDVVVVESKKDAVPYDYPGTRTVFPREAFGFNKYINIGLSMSDNQYVCICNNDLIFEKEWATAMINAFEKDPELMSINPFCSWFRYGETVDAGPQLMSNREYPETHGILTGWCIMVKRDIFRVIGKLDERFVFWYADNDYQLTLKKYNVLHALLKNSRVRHLGSQSHDSLDEKKLGEMTYSQRKVFEKKWLYNSPLHYYASRIIGGIKRRFK